MHALQIRDDWSWLSIYKSSRVSASRILKCCRNRLRSQGFWFILCTPGFRSQSKKDSLCGPLCELCVSVVKTAKKKPTTETQSSHRGPQSSIFRQTPPAFKQSAYPQFDSNLPDADNPFP